MLTAGARLGPYEIVAPLGAGGMGEVYRARDARLGRDVAIKVLPAVFAADPDRLRRFEQEAQATAALDHPNILAIFDVGSHEGSPYLVEQLLEGESLREHLRGGPLPVRKAVEIAVAVAHGLAAAHARGIVHRDLKPDNVFITTDGVVKILDFGLAKLVRGDGQTDLSTLPTETAPHVVLGTVGYMAPEQVRGLPADHRADIFALGCVLYEMLSGKRAFAAPTKADTMSAILSSNPEPLAANVHDCPPPLDAVVRRCLEKRAEDRFCSARDVGFALEAAAEPVSREIGGQARHGAAEAADERRAAQPSIAVLPFANLSADREQEYFCDGVSEEIINALAQVDSLRVVARTSAFAFKGRTEDIRKIGADLNVANVLEGSVRKSGDRLRITAQLIEVASGYHVWSERFDRQVEDVFAVQDEIALAVVDHLKVKLLSAEKTSLVRRHTSSIEAHDAYLRGLFEWNTMTPEGFARCQERYREAIRLDPCFALPYAQLADSFTSVTWWADQPPALALAQAVPLAEKALELAPDLAHAYSVLGHTRTFFLRDWSGGERLLRQAVELSPNSALAQTYLALLLMMGRGRAEEAAERARTARRLDPLSPPVNAWAGIILYFVGCRDEGLRALEVQAAATPQLWMPHYFLSVALTDSDRPARALEPAEKALGLSGASSLTVCQAAGLAYHLGDRQRGDELFGRLQERAKNAYVPPTFIARLHLLRGEPVAALRFFQQALDANDPWVASHRLLARTLPSDPRVEALMERNLP